MHVEELGPCRIEFIDDGLVHTHFRDGRIVKAEEVQEMFDAIEAHTGGRKVFVMVSVGEGTTMSNEARALASSEEASRYIAADAIVVRDFGHQLAANVFVRHHRPSRPIQMFPDKERALKWLEQQRIAIGKNGSSSQ